MVKETAKDFLDNPIEVGDIVVYMSAYYKQFEKGVVVKVNKCKFTIQGNRSRVEQRDHKVVYRIGKSGVKEFDKFDVYSDDGKYHFSTMYLDAQWDEAAAYYYITKQQKLWKEGVQVRKVV